MSDFLKPTVHVPFTPGDVFVSATLITDEKLRRGIGRVLHYDAGLTLKAELPTHRYGIVAGLGMQPGTGILHACDAEARHVSRWTPDGRPLPDCELMPGVGLGSIHFRDDGSFLAGEHLCGVRPPYHGSGHLHEFDRDGRFVRKYRTATHGGMAGFLGLTHFALAHDGRTVYYVSETGPTVSRYDIGDDRQLTDLYVRQDPPGMVFGLALAPDGDVLLALGSGVRRIDAGGSVVRDYALPAGRGWAIVVTAQDRRSFWAGDFFAGLLVRIAIDSGEVLASVDIGQRFALAGVAEYPTR